MVTELPTAAVVGLNTTEQSGGVVGAVPETHESVLPDKVKLEQFGSSKEKLAAWPTPARSRKGAEAAKAIMGFIDQVLDQG
jgi:hypothetical protein